MSEKSEHIARLLKRQAFVRAAGERYQVAAASLGMAMFFLLLVARGLWLSGSALSALILLMLAGLSGFLGWRCWQGSRVAARVAVDADWLANGKLEDKLPSFPALLRSGIHRAR